MNKSRKAKYGVTVWGVKDYGTVKTKAFENGAEPERPQTTTHYPTNTNESLYDERVRLSGGSRVARFSDFEIQAGTREAKRNNARLSAALTVPSAEDQYLAELDAEEAHSSASKLIDLTSIDQEILRLTVQGKSQREIATIYGISQPAVAKRLKRARNHAQTLIGGEHE